MKSCSFFVGCMVLVGSSMLHSAEPFYDPVEIEVQGWTVRVDPKLLSDSQVELKTQALDALANHLQRVQYIVPAERVQELQKLPIWLELDNPNLGNMQYHPNRQWLTANGHDPRLVQHVHLPQAASLIDPKMWAKHPYCVLHELAHAYHDQVLSWEHPPIIAAYEAAKAAGIYEQVLDHRGQTVRHYGLNNHKEYFAEATEAYFGVNDFHPFVRAELKQHDPAAFDVLEEIWGKIR